GCGFRLGLDYRFLRLRYRRDFDNRLSRGLRRAAGLRRGKLLLSLREFGVPLLYSSVGSLDSRVAARGSSIDSLLSPLSSSLLSSACFSRFMRCMFGSTLRFAHFLGVHWAALHWLRSTRFFQHWRRAADWRLHHNWRAAD